MRKVKTVTTELDSLATTSTIFDTYRYNRWYTDILQYQSKESVAFVLSKEHASRATAAAAGLASGRVASGRAASSGIHSRPTLTINVGLKNAASDITELLRAYVYLTILANNCESKVKLIATKALKSIASWKLRKGTPIGVKMTITDIGDIIKVLDSLQIEKGASVWNNSKGNNFGQSLNSSVIDLFIKHIDSEIRVNSSAGVAAGLSNITTQSLSDTFGFTDLFLFKFLHPYDFLRATTRDIKLGFNLTMVSA